MAQMSPAAAAMNLCAHAKERLIDGGAHRILDRPNKAGPTGARVELVLRPVDVEITARTDKDASALFVVQGAGSSPLGRMVAQNRILLRRQALSPLSITQRHLEALTVCGGRKGRRFSHQIDHKGRTGSLYKKLSTIDHIRRSFRSKKGSRRSSRGANLGGSVAIADSANSSMIH